MAATEEVNWNLYELLDAFYKNEKLIKLTREQLSRFSNRDKVDKLRSQLNSAKENRAALLEKIRACSKSIEENDGQPALFVEAYKALMVRKICHGVCSCKIVNVIRPMLKGDWTVGGWYFHLSHEEIRWVECSDGDMDTRCFKMTRRCKIHFCMLSQDQCLETHKMKLYKLARIVLKATDAGEFLLCQKCGGLGLEGRQIVSAKLWPEAELPEPEEGGWEDF